MNDTRLPFPAAKQAFIAFLRSQGWPTDVLWVCRERLAGRHRRYWVYRPEELSDDTATGEFYEAARRTETNLRIDALGQLGGRTFAYVQDYGGQRRMLNFGGADGRAFSAAGRFAGCLERAPGLHSSGGPRTNAEGQPDHW